MSTEAHDPQTLAFYEREAETYAARGLGTRVRHLDEFLALLPAGAAILELGCGAGHDAHYMLSRGFDITATDAVPAFTAIAQARLLRPVRVMRFDELDEALTYDGVWANASLHHAPLPALPGILRSIHGALKPGGIFHAGYKSGDGAARDALGRFYCFPSRAELTAAYEAAAAWGEFECFEGVGRGYDGVERTWLHVQARRAP
jgi:SAM-dependent methyltransferase